MSISSSFSSFFPYILKCRLFPHANTKKRLFKALYRFQRYLRFKKNIFWKLFHDFPRKKEKEKKKLIQGTLSVLTVSSVKKIIILNNLLFKKYFLEVVSGFNRRLFISLGFLGY